MENDIKSKILQNRFKLVYCKRFDETSDIWNTTRHKHDYMELLYFLDGNADIDLDDAKLHLTLYNMVIYPRNKEHQETIDFSKHQEVFCLGIKCDNVALTHDLHSSDNDGNLLKIISFIYNEGISQNSSDDIIDLCLKSLFLALIRETKAKKKDPIDLVIRYIELNFTNNVTVCDLASLIYVSKSYLIRKFKEKTNESPIQYTNKLRVESAKRLLANKSLTIEEITSRVGCSSSKYFTKMFKKHTGIAPSQFRKDI